MVEDDARRITWENYTADYLWGIRADIHGVFGGKYEGERFTELMQPEKKDYRSSEQIKADLLEKLTA